MMLQKEKNRYEENLQNKVGKREREIKSEKNDILLK